MVAPSPWKMSQPLTWKYGMTILLWTVNGSDDYVHDAVTKKKKKRNLLCPCGESGLELAKHCRSKIINSCWYGFEVIRLSTCYCKQKHFISWKRLPNNAVTQQRQSQFTPKMKANTVPCLLSSLVQIDQYNGCNGKTSFMEFMPGTAGQQPYGTISEQQSFKHQYKYKWST